MSFTFSDLLMRLFTSSTVGVFLAFFTPALAYIGLNAVFFTKAQIRNSLLACAFIGLVIAYLAALGYVFLATHVGAIVARLAIGALVAALLCFFNEQILRELFIKKTTRIIFVFLLHCLMLGTAFFTLAIPNGLLLIYFAASLYDLFKNRSLPKTLLFNDYKRPQRPADTDASAISFAEKPNVYIFFMESLHSEQALQALYDTDEGKKIKKFFNDYNYTVYDNAVSNTDWTLDSRTNLFEARYAQSFTKPRSKAHEAVALKVFKQNRYTINIFDHSPYILGLYAGMADFCFFSSTLPSRVSMLFQLAAPLFAQSSLWRAFTGGIDPGAPPQENATKEKCIEAVMQHVKSASKNKPNFNIICFGANHTAYYKKSTKYTPKTWPAAYLDSYKTAMQQLMSVIAHIERHDPTAAVVVMGDHGAHSLDFLWIDTEDPEEALQKAQLDRNYLYLDLFSILMAIKWPKCIEPASFSASPINLFLHLFVALSGDASLHRFLQPELCLLSHKFKDFYVVASDRRLLPSLVPLNKYPSPEQEQTLHDWVASYQRRS